MRIDAGIVLSVPLDDRDDQDTTGNGDIDAIGYDINGDGNVDYIGFVDPESGIVEDVMSIEDFVAKQEASAGGCDDDEKIEKCSSEVSKEEADRVGKEEDAEGIVSSKGEFVEIPLDLTGDGRVDAVGYDVSGDGNIDFVGLVNDETGEVDELTPIGEFLEKHEFSSISKIQGQVADTSADPKHCIVVSDSAGNVPFDNSGPPVCIKCKHPHYADEVCPICGHSWPKGPKRLRHLSRADRHTVPNRSTERATRHRALSKMDDAASHAPVAHVESPQRRHSFVRRASISDEDLRTRGASQEQRAGSKASRSTVLLKANPANPSRTTGPVHTPQRRMSHVDRDLVDDDRVVRRRGVGGARVHAPQRTSKFDAPSYIPPMSTHVHDAFIRLGVLTHHDGHAMPNRGTFVCKTTQSRKESVSVTSVARANVHAPQRRESFVRPRRGSFVKEGKARRLVKAYRRLTAYIPATSKEVYESLMHLQFDRHSHPAARVQSGASRPRHRFVTEEDAAYPSAAVFVDQSHDTFRPDRSASIVEPSISQRPKDGQKPTAKTA
eukprot:g3529.t1